MADVVRSFGLEPVALEVSAEAFGHLKIPAIAYFPPIDAAPLGHFVVVLNVGLGNVYVHDPAIGYQSYRLEAFLEKWLTLGNIPSGRLMAVVPPKGAPAPTIDH